MTGSIMSMVTTSGRQSLAELDGALAVLRLADDLDLRVGGEDLDQPLAHRQRIFDHEDAELRHLPTLINGLDHGEQLGLVELALDDVAVRADVAPALPVLGRRSAR